MVGNRSEKGRATSRVREKQMKSGTKMFDTGYVFLCEIVRELY